MEILIKKLRELSTTKPSGEFHVRSRMLATKTPQLKKTLWMHTRESLNYGLALGLGALLLIVGLGQFSYLHFNNFSPAMVGSLQTKTLVAEETQTNFTLHIADATYFNETATIVAAALKIVRDENPDHINDAVLEREMKSLENGLPTAFPNL